MYSKNMSTTKPVKTLPFKKRQDEFGVPRLPSEETISKTCDNHMMANTMARKFKETFSNMSINDVKDKVYYFLHFNCSYKRVDGFVVPGEVAIAEFSLRKGIGRVFHSFICIRELLFGDAYLAKEMSEKGNGIPVPPDCVPGAEKCPSSLLHQIVCFLLKVDPNEKPHEEFYGSDPVILPPLYTLQDNIKLSNECFTAIKEECCAELWVDFSALIQYEILPVDMLFHEMFNKIALLTKNSNKCFTTDITSTTLLTSNSYGFSPGISCQFHENIDKVEACSRSAVYTYAYVICNQCCPYAGIELIPGSHCRYSLAQFQQMQRQKNDATLSQRRYKKQRSYNSDMSSSSTPAESRQSYTKKQDFYEVIDVTDDSSSDEEKCETSLKKETGNKLASSSHLKRELQPPSPTIKQEQDTLTATISNSSENAQQKDNDAYAVKNKLSLLDDPLPSSSSKMRVIQDNQASACFGAGRGRPRKQNPFAESPTPLPNTVGAGRGRPRKQNPFAELPTPLPNTADDDGRVSSENRNNMFFSKLDDSAVGAGRGRPRTQNPFAELPTPLPNTGNYLNGPGTSTTTSPVLSNLQSQEAHNCDDFPSKHVKTISSNMNSDRNVDVPHANKPESFCNKKDLTTIDKKPSVIGYNGIPIILQNNDVNSELIDNSGDSVLQNREDMFLGNTIKTKLIDRSKVVDLQKTVHHDHMYDSPDVHHDHMYDSPDVLLTPEGWDRWIKSSEKGLDSEWLRYYIALEPLANETSNGSQNLQHKNK